jgi:outer membrane protein TolC
MVARWAVKPYVEIRGDLPAFLEIDCGDGQKEAAMNRGAWRRMIRLGQAGLLTLAAACPHAAAQKASGQEAPLKLTLAEAIEQGLRNNLSVLVAETRVDEDAGARERALAAAVLPRVSAETYANVQNRSLRAFGISAPGFPNVVGPFSNYDFRVYAQQNVLNLESYHGLKASEQALEAGKLDEQDARDLIVRLVAGYYLNAQSAAARAEAARTRVADAETLRKLAEDRHQAGTATGVDVLRAQVQLANDRQALLEAENQRKQALLELARQIGLSPATPLDLAEPLRFAALTESDPESLTRTALAARFDYLSLEKQREGLEEQSRANRARWYPRVSISGNVGELGRSVGSVDTTGGIQGQIDFTLFDRDREGEAQQIASRLKRIDDQIGDLSRGVEEEIRSALLNLESAAEQVTVAQQGQELARRELDEARDRFEAGTANNVEVVTAQDELARAEENTILAISSHVDAKVALARALGNTKQNLLRWAGNSQ